MKHFRLFIESDDGSALLNAHFGNFREDTPWLVLADWLQEQGEDDLANQMRHVITGHGQSKASEWHGKVPPMSRNHNADDTRMTFALHDQPKVQYHLSPEGTIEYRAGKGKFKPLPQSSWTLPIVKAAAQVIIRYLKRTPVPLFRDDNVDNLGRNDGLHVRQYQALINQMGHLANEMSMMMREVRWMEPDQRGYASNRKRILDDYRYLEKLCTKLWDWNKAEKDSVNYEALKPQAHRTFEVMNGMRDTIRTGTLDIPGVGVGGDVSYNMQFIMNWLNLIRHG